VSLPGGRKVKETFVEEVYAKLNSDRKSFRRTASECVLFGVGTEEEDEGCCEKYAMFALHVSLNRASATRTS